MDGWMDGSRNGTTVFNLNQDYLLQEQSFVSSHETSRNFCHAGISLDVRDFARLLKLLS